ncbi:MAG: TlpA disulfide reductase family protein [Gemmataceae bacterium]
MRMLLLVLGILVLALATGSTQAQPSKQTNYPTKQWIGKSLPPTKSDFALNSEQVSLADLKGKVVLIDFWAVWCLPCRTIFPTVNRLHETYKEQGLEVLALTTYYGKYDFQDGKLTKPKKPLTVEAERKMLERFAQHFKLGYRIQTMPKEQFAVYKVFAIPQAMLLDRSGKVRHVVIGGNPSDWKTLEAKIQELLKEPHK